MQKLLVAYKWLISFFKSEWSIHDYPLRFREQVADDPSIPRWYVQIINWWQVIGTGATREEALKDVSESFSRIKESREIPRPGTGLPIEFKSGNELEKNWGVASRIISEVLGYDPNEIFVSDDSTLWEFAAGDDIDEYQIQIKNIFGVDVSHIESGNLVEISRHIANGR